MKKITRNVLLGTLGAGLFALATTPITVNAAQTRRIGAWIHSGLEVVSSVNGWLDQNEEETDSRLAAERCPVHGFAATCDERLHGH